MKNSRLMTLALAASLLVFSSAGMGQGTTKSLRGDTPVEATSNAEMFKIERDRSPIPRDYVQQPPLIPHTTKGYTITANFNKCMDCHAWSRYKDSGATKVSLTHFKDRDGRELANISPRRYFCTQCHVPQYDAKPLVSNVFKPVDELRH